jgi:hypothetical protein
LIHDFNKVDEIHDEYGITCDAQRNAKSEREAELREFDREFSELCQKYSITVSLGVLLQGGSDESRFGRVFNPALRATHFLDFREEVVRDGEVRRKKVIVWMRPKELHHIRMLTDDFTQLSPLELRELVRRYNVTLPKVEGRPDAQTDRLNMIEALRAFKPPKPRPVEAGQQTIVIPPEIEAMDEKDAVTRAGVLGVSVKGAGGKQVDLPTIKQRIARKLSEKEQVAP